MKTVDINLAVKLIESKIKESEARINQMVDRIEKNSVDLKVGVNQQSIMNTQTFFKNLLAAAGIVAGLKGLFDFLKNSVQAYAEEEEAVASLTQQLGYQSQVLLDLAAARQRVTKYGDDQTIQAMALLAAFTKDEQKIKALTIATQDLAAAKKMDLASAADIVGKSFGSSTNALARYGIEVTGAAGSTERLNSLVKGLTDLYGGQAEAAGKTFSGRMEIIKNRVGDLQEKIGQALIPVLDKLSVAFEGILAEADSNKPFEGIAMAAKIAGSAVLFLFNQLYNTGIMLGTIGAAMAKFVLGKWGESGQILFKGMQKIEMNLAKTTDFIAQMFKTSNDEIVKNDEIKTGRIIAGSKKEQKEKEELNKKLTDGLDRTSKLYYDDQVKRIKDEVEKFKKAGMDKVKIDAWAKEQLKKNDEEYYKAKYGMSRAEKEAFDLFYGKRADITSVSVFRPSIKPKSLGKVSAGSGEDAESNLFTRWDIKEWEANNEVLAQSFTDLTSNLSSSWAYTFDDMLSGTISFGEGVKHVFTSIGSSILSTLTQIASKYASMALISGLGSLIPGVGSFSTIFSFLSGKASGGSVLAGTPYVVGEKGPELFLPKTSGYILPNDMMNFGSNNNSLLTEMKALRNDVRAMNMNLVSKEMNVTVNNAAPEVRTTVIKNKGVENRLVKSGMNLSEL